MDGSTSHDAPTPAPSSQPAGPDHAVEHPAPHSTARDASTAPATPPVDPRYVEAWARIATAALGRPVPADPARLTPPARPSVLEQVRSAAAHAEFARLLATGAPLERATYAGVAALTAAQDPDAAWALTEAVRRLPSGHTAAQVGRVVLRHRLTRPERVWELAAGLDDDVLADYVPVEAVDGALADGRPDARERARAITADPSRFADAALVDLAGRFLVAGDHDRAGELMTELRRRPAAALTERSRASARHIEAAIARAAKPVPDGAVPFAILDYQSPDQDAASQNLGDYVQTLALMANLARFSDVRFSGEGGLGELATEVQQQVRADLRITGHAGAVHLLDVNREFSSADAVPPNTWTIAFGWHMHPLYRGQCDFPYHPNLRPIFLAFHVSNPAMLTEAGLDYLRRYGPVGCRDRSTVDLLLSRDVDAFFSGCLTPSIDAIFPDRDDVYPGDGPVGVIDLPRSAAGPDADDAVVVTHAADEYREMTLVDAMRAARTLFAERQAQFSRVVTSRLHAYLPFIALGVPVEFRPLRRGDPRFPGLSGMTPGSPRLRRMQRDVRALVADVLALLLDGASEDEVYTRWRELVADRVAEDRKRFAAPIDAPRPSFDTASAVASVRAAARRYGPPPSEQPAEATDVVLAVDRDLAEPATALIESVLANASGPVRLWLLARGLDPADEQRLVSCFPSTAITVLPLDDVPAPGRVLPATVDRLLVPDLLADVDRAVYLDLATLVLGDVCELAATDLHGHALAAREQSHMAHREWRRVAMPLPERRAAEWLHSMSAGQPFDAPALDDGVLVLDLHRLRADRFSDTWLGPAERYGLDFAQALLGYAGPQRHALPPRWNAMPLREDVADPAIVHWTGTAMPWQPQLCPYQDRWREYADRRPGHRMPGGLVLSTPGSSDGP